MAIDYATLQIQFGALLRVSRGLAAEWEFAKKSSDVSHFRRVLSVANGFLQDDTEEAQAYSDMCAFYDEVARTAAEKWSSHRTRIEGEFFNLLKRDLPASAEKEVSGAISYAYENIDGAITISARNGVLGALRKDMLTNTQYITANVIAFTGGVLVADSGNRGSVPTVNAMAGLSHTLAGTMVYTVASESVTAPTLNVSIELPYPLPDGTEIIKAENVLTLEKSHEDGHTGITQQLTRPGLAAPTEVGDTGNIFSASSFTTPKTGDMAGGILYVRITRQASDTWLIEYFNDSSLTVRVGSDTTSTLVGNYTIAKVLKNGTHFNSTVDRAAANTQCPVVGNSQTTSFDIKTPRLGDRWTIPVTNNAAGVIATKMAQLWRWSPPVAGVSMWAENTATSLVIT
jgi:hypothetical protein